MTTPIKDKSADMAKLLAWLALLGLATVMIGAVMHEIRKPAERLLR